MPRLTFIRNIGFILLAILLILYGITTLVGGFPAMGLILAILAIAAGICILFGW